MKPYQLPELIASIVDDDNRSKISIVIISKTTNIQMIEFCDHWCIIQLFLCNKDFYLFLSLIGQLIACQDPSNNHQTSIAFQNSWLLQSLLATRIANRDTIWSLLCTKKVCLVNDLVEKSSKQFVILYNFCSTK